MVVLYFARLGVCGIHFSGKSILTAGFAGQGIINKDLGAYSQYFALFVTYELAQ
jgi:hypothetical protein